MLTSVRIQKRQSEIRQQLAVLAAKDSPDDNEIRSLNDLDKEFQTNEQRFRAALVAESEERAAAGAELEGRSEKEFADLIGKFELRQVALHLDEGAKIDGATAEIVQQLRSHGGYRGVPVPYQALEIRAGETVAPGTPSPVNTAPIIDRIFADSVAGKMGTRFVNIAQGTNEYPITSSAVTGGWASTETGAVAGPTAYSTANRSLAPNSTYGIQMKITRKALKQSGDALEQAVRRDMNGCLAVGMDKAVFLGSGSSGEPTGVMKAGSPSAYGITSTAVNAAASWSAFRAAVTRFMVANAASGPGSVNLLLRPELYDDMDEDVFTGTAISQWDKLVANVGNVVLSSNALAAPTGSPLASKALLTTTVNGVAPIFVGTWGAIDLIRDVYSDAASGGLRLTALATMDVTVSRAEQLQILTGIQ
jgi:HK97 family phage major capsid protein